jgi:hypothetical protein
MPFGRKADAKKKAAVKPKVGSDSKTILRVEPYNHWQKFALMPFVKDGSPLYLPRGTKSEKKYLTKAGVLSMLDSEHTELCRRLRFGLSMKAACIQEMGEFLADNREDILNSVGKLAAVLAPGGEAEESDGGKFVEACRFLNTSTDIDRDEATAVESINALFHFLEAEKSLEKLLREIIMIAARMYLGATSIFELLALSSKPKEWAAKMEPKGEQPKATRNWLDDPKSVKKLKRAMVRSILDVEKKGKRDKRTTLKDSGASSGSETSNEETGRKTKSKRASKKKTGRKREASSDSSSSAEAAEKKAKKGDSSSSSSSSDADEKRKKVQKKMKKQTKKEAQTPSKRNKKEEGGRKKRGLASSSTTEAEASSSDGEAGKRGKDKKVKAKTSSGEAKVARKDPGETTTKVTSKATAAAKVKAQEEELKLERAREASAEIAEVSRLKRAHDDARTAAFTSWSQGSFQELEARAATLLASVGGASGGVYPLADVRALWEGIPQEILDVKDSLKKHIAEAKGDGKEEKTTVENGLARRIVSGVMGLAAEAAEFYEEQQAANAAGSATAADGAGAGSASASAA